MKSLTFKKPQKFRTIRIETEKELDTTIQHHDSNIKNKIKNLWNIHDVLTTLQCNISDKQLEGNLSGREFNKLDEIQEQIDKNLLSVIDILIDDPRYKDLNWQPILSEYNHLKQKYITKQFTDNHYLVSDIDSMRSYTHELLTDLANVGKKESYVTDFMGYTGLFILSALILNNILNSKKENIL